MTIWSQRFYRVSGRLLADFLFFFLFWRDSYQWPSLLMILPTRARVCVVELLFRLRNLLQPHVHPLRLETRLVGNRRQNLRVSGNLRDAALPPRAVCDPDFLRHSPGFRGGDIYRDDCNVPC